MTRPLHLSAILGGAVLFGGLALPADAPRTVDVAVAAGLHAIEQCRLHNQTVSVAIVGPEGELRVLIRGDGAPPHSVESARRKAYTALSFAKPTADLADLAEHHADFAGLARLDDVLFVGGGVPIVAGGKAIGAVGVAGANGPGLDESCARAARDSMTGGQP